MLNRDFAEILSAFTAERVEYLVVGAYAFIRLGTAPNAIDLLTDIPGVTFDEAFAARTTLTLDGIPVPTLSREHLIRAKRAAGRPQDLADVSRLEEQK